MVRLGRQLRALRRRRGWRQLDLAEAAGVSQSLVSLVERGHGDRLSIATLSEMTRTLEARLQVSISWRAGDLDRAMDARHAAVAVWVAALLRALGWDVHAEVTFSIGGERGSIDLLAWHAGSRSLLVIEIKSELASLEATLRNLDVKARLGRVVAGRFGWRPATVSRLIVAGRSSTNRRRMLELAALAGPGFVTDAWAIRRWIARPDAALNGGWVVSVSTPRGTTSIGGGSHRVRRPASCSGRTATSPDAARRT